MERKGFKQGLWGMWWIGLFLGNQEKQKEKEFHSKIKQKHLSKFWRMLLIFFSEINGLSISLQGNTTNIWTVQDKVVSFVHELEHYQRRIRDGDIGVYTALWSVRKWVNERIVFETSIVQHLSAVINSMKQYFSDLDNRQHKSLILRPFPVAEEVFKEESRISRTSWR